MSNLTTLATALALRPHSIHPQHPLAPIERSNLPEHHKTDIRQWVESIFPHATVKSPVASAAEEGADVVRSGIEALGAGALLGLLEKHVGLDAGGVPLDGLVGALLGAGAVGLAAAGSPLAHTSRIASAVALGSAMQRKVSGRPAEVSSAPKLHGDPDDPIVAWGKTL